MAVPDNINPRFTALNQYAALQTRPKPAGLAQPQGPFPTGQGNDAQFDWFSAAPIQQTPQGMVQAPNTGQKDLVPGTLFGGLVDTRYSQGLEPMMSSSYPTRPIDTDLATGVPQYQREATYANLLNAQQTVQKNLDDTAARAARAKASGLHPTVDDARALDFTTIRQPAVDTLNQSLGAFLQNQQPVDFNTPNTPISDAMGIASNGGPVLAKQLKAATDARVAKTKAGRAAAKKK
jgi:hypothetical protein